MYENPMSTMTGKRVRIIANDIAYTGLLVEVTETSVELQGDGQWVTIPVDCISSISAEGDAPDGGQFPPATAGF